MSDKRPISMPKGNSPTTPDAEVRPEEDRRSDNSWGDIATAVGRIRPVRDVQALGTHACEREALLYGIAGGSAIFAVRFLGTRRIKSACNWAIGSFVAIACLSKYVCETKRDAELAQMRQIQERYPHRHISNLKRTGADWVPPPTGGENGDKKE